MNQTVKLRQLLPLQTGEGKNGPWKKQDIIVETDGQYPKKICVSVWGDKIDINRFKTGDSIEIYFDVESREYNGRWYTDCKAWKIESVGGSTGADDNYSQPSQPPPPLPPAEDADLPF